MAGRTTTYPHYENSWTGQQNVIKNVTQKSVISRCFFTYWYMSLQLDIGFSEKEKNNTLEPSL